MLGCCQQMMTPQVGKWFGEELELLVPPMERIDGSRHGKQLLHHDHARYTL